MDFEAPLPADMADVVSRLREKTGPAPDMIRELSTSHEPRKRPDPAPDVIRG